jgi:16S rRNA (adenine1518-N6/adenine1519-N6)-dimethyltransferase
METLIKVGFSSKRKMLRNNLKGIVERDDLSHLLEQLNIDPQARAEDLSVADWVHLSNQLQLTDRRGEESAVTASPNPETENPGIS